MLSYWVAAEKRRLTLSIWLLLRKGIATLILGRFKKNRKPLPLFA
jgi:hypothetical protein